MGPSPDDLGAQEAGLADALLDASPDAVLVVGPDGVIQAANRAVEVLFGYVPSELVGQGVELLVPEGRRAGHASLRGAYVRQPSARPMGIGLDLAAQRKDGSTIPVDIGLAPVAVSGASATGVFVRDARERRRSESLLLHVNEISQQLLAGRPTGEILGLTAAHVRTLVNGASAWLVEPLRPGLLVVAAADGLGAEELIGATLDAASSHSARAMAGGEPVVIADLASDAEVLTEARELGLGPGLYLPLASEHGSLGALVVGRRRGQENFGPGDLNAAEVFASAAGVVLALGRARSELEALRLTAEYERIARDLHDNVIQRLFAVGMGLQGVQRLAAGSVAERIDQSVQALDSVIRDIRETIFDLNRPLDAPADLRSQLHAVVHDATPSLGFRPSVSLRGPVASAVPDEVVPHLLSVLREALSNVARHAGASQVQVVLGVEEDWVILTVTDDGAGVDRHRRGGGNGLANMAERAHLLEGEMVLLPGESGGTSLRWQVPVGPGSIKGTKAL